MKSRLMRLGQILVTILALGWVFRNPEMRRATWVTLSSADMNWILLGILISGIGEFANILRWYIFLRVQKIKVPLAHAASLYMIGVFFNLFLVGATGGDVVRTIYLAGEFPSKKGAVILSVIADRLIGLLVLIPYTFLIVALRHDWLSQTPVTSGLLWFLITFTICWTVVAVILFFVSLFNLVQKLPGRMPWREKLVNFSYACSLFGRAKLEMLTCVALSIPVLFAVFGTFYCAAQAYHAGVSTGDICSIMPVVIVITSFPVSFSGVGIREQLFQTLLGDLAGVPAEIAVLISLAGFSIYVVWSLVGAGCYFLYKKADPVPCSSLSRGSAP